MSKSFTAERNSSADDANEPLTLDLVLRLPASMREQSRSRSARFAARMRQNGRRSHFVLGERVPWGTELAEPHVSIFMLSAPHESLSRIADTLDRLTAHLPPIEVVGERYAHNPFGAPELYFRRTQRWRDVQNAVIAAVEPFRQGRIRPEGPFGEPLPAILAGVVLADSEQRRQLRETGYDEVGERFNPHITEAAPTDPTFRVDLHSMPEPSTVAGVLTTLALYRMGPYGTCLTNYHQSELRGH